jgi:hypothetical protein
MFRREFHQYPKQLNTRRNVITCAMNRTTLNNRHYRILADIEIDSRVLEGLAKPTGSSARSRAC